MSTITRRQGQTVAVIGAGASGTLLAAQLLRRGEPGSRVVLPRRLFGRSRNQTRSHVSATPRV